MGLQNRPTASLQRGKTPPPNECPDMTSNNLMVMLQSWSLGNAEYLFIANAFRSTQSRVVALDRILSMGQMELVDI